MYKTEFRWIAYDDPGVCGTIHARIREDYLLLLFRPVYDRYSRMKGLSILTDEQVIYEFMTINYAWFEPFDLFTTA